MGKVAVPSTRETSLSVSQLDGTRVLAAAALVAYDSDKPELGHHILEVLAGEGLAAAMQPLTDRASTPAVVPTERRADSRAVTPASQPTAPMAPTEKPRVAPGIESPVTDITPPLADEGQSKRSGRKVIAGIGVALVGTSVVGAPIAKDVLAGPQLNAASCNTPGKTRVDFSRVDIKASVVEQKAGGMLNGLRELMGGDERITRWSEVANYISKKVGYDVSVAQVTELTMQEKTKAVDMRTGSSLDGLPAYEAGMLQDAVVHDGPVCLAVPGPTAYGQTKTHDKMMTMRQVADAHKMSVEQLQKLNPGLPTTKDAQGRAPEVQPLGEGKVLQVADKLDTRFILQEVKGVPIDMIFDFKDPNVKQLLERAALINDAPLIGKDGKVTGRFYLPLRHGIAKQLKEAAPDKEVKIIPTKSSYAEKPKPNPAKPAEAAPTKPTEQGPAVKPPEVHPDIRKPAPELKAEQEAALAKYAEAVKAIPEAKRSKVCSPLVLAQAIERSNWGTSEAASKNNNPFGLLDDKKELRSFKTVEDGIEAFVDRIIKSPYNDTRFFGKEAPTACGIESRTFMLSEVTNKDVRVNLTFRFFMERGLTPEEVAGMIGNFVRESGMNPAAEQKYGGSAKGLAQWEGNRWIELPPFAEKRGEEWQDFFTQLQYIVHEFETSENAAYKALIKTETVNGATDAVAYKYERPNPTPSSIRMDLRRQWAHEAYADFKRYHQRYNETIALIDSYKMAELVGDVETQAKIKTLIGQRVG